MPAKTKSNPGPDRWSHDATVLLLAYASLRTDAFTKDRTSALHSAAEYLTTELGQLYKAQHVDSKITRLWQSYGPDHSNSTKDIYEHGVHWRTLPHLEGLRRSKVTFQEIAAKLKSLKG